MLLQKTLLEKKHPAGRKRKYLPEDDMIRKALRGQKVLVHVLWGEKWAKIAQMSITKAFQRYGVDCKASYQMSKQSRFKYNVYISKKTDK